MKQSKSLFIRNTLFNIVLTIGIVIGVGIFFKNESIIAAAHGNAAIVISAWIIGAVVSIASALAFSLLNLKSKNNDNNIAEFINLTYGSKWGKISKISFMYIYYPIYLFVIAIFTTNKMFQLFGYTDKGYIYTLILIITSISICLVFLTFIFFAPKISKITQISTTILKLIPFFILIIVVVGGIFTSNNNSYWVSSGQSNLNQDIMNQTSGKSSIAIVFWIIPAVKFSFDGFISITGNKRSTSIKSVTLGITIGMIIVTALYIVTTIAVLQEGVTNVPDAIISFFGANLQHLSLKFLIIKKVLLAIIVISGLGSVNGFTIIWFKMAIQIKDDYKFKNSTKSILVILLSAFIIGLLPWIILSLSLGNNVEVFDIVSDIVLLFGFSVNALILINVIYKRFKKKIQVSWVFITFAIISIIGISLTAGWKIVDDLIISQILHGTDTGIFGAQKWIYVILFVFVFAQFALSPIIVKKIFNKFLRKDKTFA